MIELRWEWKSFKYPDPQIDPDDRQHVKVLQYRTHRTVVEWHGKAVGFPRQEWSEWQDVPEGPHPLFAAGQRKDGE
jgi:hypothetical protein